MTARLHRPWTVALVAAFIVALVAPGCIMLAGLDTESMRGENRELAAPPAFRLDWRSLRAWPPTASRYLEDHFGLRSWLVRQQASIRLRYFHVSASPDVIRGRDGWFFYAGDGGREDMAAEVPLSESELALWCQTLQHTHDWLHARGIAYLFVVTPDKYTIYPEQLPDSVRRVGRETRTDALVRYLREHSTVPVLDLRPALLASKGTERLYHRTDTHWNDRGAFVGYTEVVRALSPALGTPMPRNAFDARSVPTPGLDLAGMLGLTSELTEEDLRMLPRQPRRARVIEPAAPDAFYMEARLVTTQSDASLPRAVVFRDSFTSAMIPFLSEHFSRALYLWQYNVDPDIVRDERPRVVIQQWVGRRLTTLLPYDPFAGGSH